MIIVLLDIIGLLGIGAGIWAVRWLKRARLSQSLSQSQRRLRLAALILGAVIALASWPLTYAMGYPYSTPEGVGRVVGIPFMTAFFDSEGLDYVGDLTVFAVIGNMIFWFLLPQLILAIRLRGLSPKANER